jgi:mono/diheme cytochrome c family protein
MNFRKIRTVVLAFMIVLTSMIVLIFMLPLANAMGLEQGSGAVEGVKEMDIEKFESAHIGNVDSIEKGLYLYGNTCLFCHGSKGIGSRAPTLIEGGFKPDGNYSNEDFINTIRFGRAGTIMGSFSTTLTQTEMWQIMAYLRDQAAQVDRAKKQ